MHVIQFEKHCPKSYISFRKLNTWRISCAKIFFPILIKFGMRYNSSLTYLVAVSFTSE
uniref:Uncharacterized protein n=2 Tax=Cercopithecinae TaxID=9528 RepID=A0A2K5XFZ8_MANLE|nr:unnamed protein product [Macaca fascicularis]